MGDKNLCGGIVSALGRASTPIWSPGPFCRNVHDISKNRANDTLITDNQFLNDSNYGQVDYTSEQNNQSKDVEMSSYNTTRCVYTGDGSSRSGTKVIGSFCDLRDTPLHPDANHLVPHVPIGQTYTLTARETEQCMMIGRERNDKNVQQKTKNMNFSQRNDEQISVQGVVGELAFSRLFGLPIEIFDTTCRNAYNDTFDAVLPNGWKVDVKTTVRLDAPIIVSKWKRVRPPELYALLILENYSDRRNISPERLPRVCFKGFVHSGVILQDANLDVMKSGFVHYRWPQEKLKTLEQVIENPTGS